MKGFYWGDSAGLCTQDHVGHGSSRERILSAASHRSEPKVSVGDFVNPAFFSA